MCSCDFHWLYNAQLIGTVMSVSLIVHFADITRLELFTHFYKHITHVHGDERRRQDSVVIRQSWRTAVCLHLDAKQEQPDKLRQ